MQGKFSSSNSVKGERPIQSNTSKISSHPNAVNPIDYILL